ncbi:Subtilisin-like protease SBT3 [Euphorbia peplus]|nr:Subtilisin-like protease SBT3 [Euphorbia peplus]
MEIECAIFLTFFFYTYAIAESHTYIIHMDSTAMPTAFSNHHYWYLATLSSISGTANQHLYTYTSSANGFSATLTNSELEAIGKQPGYISHSRDRPLKVHTTHTSQFLGLSTASGAWPGTNYGEDVVIGLVDGGIWPESESFGDEGMTPVPSRWKGKCESGTQFNSTLCNKKLIGAYYFNKGYIAENPDEKMSMNSSRDTDGHGTHTASIAAGSFVEGASFFGYANGTASGMAPRARIAIYKVVWRYGIYESDVLAAIDQAIKDRVDILSFSIAFHSEYDYSLDEDTIAVATFAAIKEGIFVAASAGNPGPFRYSVVNGAPWLLTVGAGTIDRDFGGILTLGNGNKISFRSLYPGSYSQSPTSLLFLDGCTTVEEMKTNRKSIIVCKDNLSMSDQYQRANTANVLGAVFITNSSVDVYMESPFPAAFLSLKDGKRVVDYIQKTNNPKGSLQFQKTMFGLKPAPMVDFYSGRGPFASCRYIIKPDIIAPGTSVLASWSPISSVTEVRKKPLFSNFNLDTGTSMSTPHVAGVAALIKSAHPNWSPAAIRSALMTTANPLDNTNGPIRDVTATDHAPATPLDIGSGHVDPNKSLNPGLIYDATPQDYIDLLCAMNYTKRQMQIITKSNPNCLNKSLDLNYPSFIAYFTGSNASESDFKLVNEFQRTVTNVGEAVSSYSAKLTSMKGIRVKVEPQKLVFKHKYEKLSYKLTVEGPKLMKEDVVYGSLSWVHDQGRYMVRSPIVATRLLPWHA